MPKPMKLKLGQVTCKDDPEREKEVYRIMAKIILHGEKKKLSADS